MKKYDSVIDMVEDLSSEGFTLGVAKGIIKQRDEEIEKLRKALDVAEETVRFCAEDCDGCRCEKVKEALSAIQKAKGE